VRKDMMSRGKHAMRGPLIERRNPSDGTLLSKSTSTRLVDAPAPIPATYAAAGYSPLGGWRESSSRRAAQIGLKTLFKDALPKPETAMLHEEASPLQNQGVVRKEPLTGYVHQGKHSKFLQTPEFNTARNQASSTKTASKAWPWPGKDFRTSRVVSESPAERGFYRTTVSLQNEATPQRVGAPRFTPEAATGLFSCCFSG